MSDLRENLANKNILFSFIFLFYSILGFLKRILNYLDRVYINFTLEFLRIRNLDFIDFSHKSLYEYVLTGSLLLISYLHTKIRY